MFTPTGTIGGIPVRRGEVNGKGCYVDSHGRRVSTAPGRGVDPLPEGFVFEEPEPELPPVDITPDMPTTVRLHADAVACLIRAAVWPEWGCAAGFAQSPRGDSATCNPNERGPNGEKVVRICTVSPGRVSAAYEILVPEYLTFETHKKA